MVEFAADEDGLRIGICRQEFAVEFYQPGSHAVETLCLPLEILADIESRSEEIVSLEARDKDSVLACWLDGGIQQTAGYKSIDREKQPAFPEMPEQFATSPPGLLKALDEAVQTAAHDGTRYAIQRLQLRGGAGEVVASDGRQLLVQGSFKFPWTDDVLISHLPIFGCKELGQDEPVEIGKTDKHVVLRVGSWTIWLRIDAEARYPQVEQVIPKLNSGMTHLRIAPEDAIFLSRVLPRLPGKDDEHQPLTIDLNGEVSLRARAAGQTQATEVVLAHSEFTGKPVRFCMDRQFLARALQLGFSDFHFPGTDTPFVCRDNLRTFLAMPLSKEGAIAPSRDSLRVTSAEGEQPRQASNTERKKIVMPPTTTNGIGNGQSAPQRKATTEAAEQNGHSTTSPVIVEAQALKDVLRDCYNQASRFVAALKRQRKQSKLVQNTIASLRQLQQIDG